MSNAGSSLLSAYHIRALADEADDPNDADSRWLRGLAHELSHSSAVELAERYPRYARLDREQAVARLSAHCPTISDPAGVLERYLAEQGQRFGRDPNDWILDTESVDELEVALTEQGDSYGDDDSDVAGA